MLAYQQLAKYYDMIYGKKEDIIEECDFLETIFKKYHKPKTIVDLGCGTGNHALVLAKRGYKLIGVDSSDKMIKEAQNKIKEKKTDVIFFVQDIRYLKLLENVDCAICMFNVFGYLRSNQDLEQFFSNLRNNLKEDALFIFEFWNIEGIKPTPYKNWNKRAQNDTLLYRLVRSNFNIQTNVLESDKEIIVIKNNQLLDHFNEKHDLRCYTIFELKQLLERNYFDLVGLHDFNNKELKEPERKSFRIIAIAKMKLN